ncbi:hypothetical protein HHL25_05400 [Rhizobium sp. S-51]|uniref:Uncharacterized protein n=1 Tax=Rhizobium terricola TaxID=2728849 RepID=A0A7Y0FV96_9HYPH|nr:hypothetical protein [Rhizobium terricola]NML73561.1 hypothetical protein [Rhizobium terricola]
MIRSVAMVSLLLLANSADAASVSENAFMEITREGAPKLYKQWGKDGFARINQALKRAVEITATSGECDNVFLSGYSFDQSVPKDTIVVFADCNNGKRFFYTEEETKSVSAAPESLQGALEKITNSDAVSACEALARKSAKLPSTVVPSYFGANVTRGQMGISVALPFEAKSALGAMLPYVAHCSITDKEPTLISIKER